MYGYTPNASKFLTKADFDRLLSACDMYALTFYQAFRKLISYEPILEREFLFIVSE